MSGATASPFTAEVIPKSRIYYRESRSFCTGRWSCVHGHESSCRWQRQVGFEIRRLRRVGVTARLNAETGKDVQMNDAAMAGQSRVLIEMR
jgi:hypothetical protein